MLTEQLLRKLETLTIQIRQQIYGTLSGDRLSIKRGPGIEFSDYRSYSPGDDIRKIDWNTYARTENFFLKLYACELELTINIIIDASASMSFGIPRKFDFARQIACALLFIGLCNLDRVKIYALSETLHESVFFRTKAVFHQAVSFLADLTTGGMLSERILKVMASRLKHGSATILITDMLWHFDFESAIKLLLMSGSEVVVIHVLSPQEMNPEIYGDFRLIDAETRDAVDVSLGPFAIRKYKRQLRHFLDRVKSFCHTHNIFYSFVVSDESLETYLLKHLQITGLLT